MNIYSTGVSVLALLMASAASAQTVPPPSTGAEVIVTGVLEQSETDVLQGTSVLKGKELTRDLRPTIGETLARLPGVSATSFGPSASRPILRGFRASGSGC